jgi:hypothetical protein
MSNQSDFLNSASDIDKKEDIEIKKDDENLDFDEKKDEEEISLPARQTIQESLTIIQSHVQRIQKLLNGDGTFIGEISETVTAGKDKIEQAPAAGNKVIEGVFDGQMMIGPDGKKYQVPPNYASKSKLVEGDILKLTIADNGSFIYKQIGPIDRDRIMGQLTKDVSTGDFRVKTDKKIYKVLTASVTYFKGEDGDEITILIPKNSESNWAAVENIIGKTS